MGGAVGSRWQVELVDLGVELLVFLAEIDIGLAGSPAAAGE